MPLSPTDAIPPLPGEGSIPTSTLDPGPALQELRPKGDPVAFTFEGRDITARSGETVASALVAAGVRELRETFRGEPRGIFCGMGVCQDCLVHIEGEGQVRACMRKVDRPLVIRRGSAKRSTAGIAARRPPGLIGDVPAEELDVLIVGGGPAGLSAAIAAARTGLRATLVDERANLGGQYFKQLAVENGAFKQDRQHLEGTELITEARRAGVDLRTETEIWAAESPGEILAMHEHRVQLLRPRRVVVAAGAYERAVPVPGWTLPGVITTGAAQSLWRSYGRLPGTRVIIAGNGPLNLQVAAELSSAGAEIVAVIELAPFRSPRRLGAFARMLAAAPGLVAQGAGYLGHVLGRGVPVLQASVVTRIERARDGLSVWVGAHPSDGAPERVLSADTVCFGMGFEPSAELLRGLGCKHVYDDVRGHFVTVTHADGRTSVPNLLAVGDCTGLGGARVAMAMGALAGFAAAGDLGRDLRPFKSEIAMTRRRAHRHRRFQRALWALYQAPWLNLELARPDTILCRCEGVTFAQVEASVAGGYASIGEHKRATRCGMGPCQGRYCGPLLTRYLAQAHGHEPREEVRFAPRWPAKPVRIADVANLNVADLDPAASKARS